MQVFVNLMEKKDDKLKNKATLRLNMKISLLLRHVFVGLNAHKYMMLMDFPREVEALAEMGFDAAKGN